MKMNDDQGYGVVYTPESLSDFVSTLLIEEYISDGTNVANARVLDPACGAGSLLNSMYNVASSRGIVNWKYIGVDVDPTAICYDRANSISSNFEFINLDSITQHSSELWQEKISDIDFVIANPPWSSDRIYDKDSLIKSGFSLVDGQYDSFVLFIESSLKSVKDGGYCAFIVPDSIFGEENEALRKLLCKRTQIRVIARLGEKIFPGINRATAIVIIKKQKTANSWTNCFRLGTEQRKRYLCGETSLYAEYTKSKHSVSQSRFCRNKGYAFDIDTTLQDESLLEQIQEDAIDWNSLFEFGRGVEISKSGRVVKCPSCGTIQGYSSSQKQKLCVCCRIKFSIVADNSGTIIYNDSRKGCMPIIVGENVQRYSLTGNKYIESGIEGINYKGGELYAGSKLIVRKTGLGINATIDDNGLLVSQTVYICKLKSGSSQELYYYLGLLNSRVVFYYYLKKYGEVEWKSHPYFTKTILYNLPIKKWDHSSKLCQAVSHNARSLATKYDRHLDLSTEKLVEKLYGIDDRGHKILVAYISSLPDLSAINGMRYGER